MCYQARLLCTAVLALTLATLPASTQGAAPGADATCDAALKAHNPPRPNTVCAAVGGTCPAGCLAAFKALDSSCAGKKYTHEKTIDGKDVEVALDWNTDKAAYLNLYQHRKDLLGKDGACHKVIHDYQLEHINDCDEAYQNAVWDVTHGWYCKDKSSAITCAPECQQSIDKLESVCNPAGGPLGTYKITADDQITTIDKTYNWESMAAIYILGPDGCRYTTSTSGATTAGFSVVLFVSMLAAPLLLLA